MICLVALGTFLSSDNVWVAFRLSIVSGLFVRVGVHMWAAAVSVWTLSWQCAVWGGGMITLWGCEESSADLQTCCWYVLLLDTVEFLPSPSSGCVTDCCTLDCSWGNTSCSGYCLCEKAAVDMIGAGAECGPEAAELVFSRNVSSADLCRLLLQQLLCDNNSLS